MKTDNNIREELKHIAPVLANVEKRENDAVPATFFSAMNEKTINVIRLEEKQRELESIAPLLATLQKQGTTSVSDVFFAQMQANTWKQIQANTTIKRQAVEKSSTLDRLLDLLFKPSFAMGFAACFALVFCSTLFLTNDYPMNSTTIANAQQLSNSEIEAYVAENNDEFDESLLTKDFDIENNKSILENSSLNEEELNAYFNSELNNEKI